MDLGRWRARLSFILILTVVGSALSVGVTGGAEYALSVDGGIDTPDKTITVEGQSFPVSETVRVEPGDPITVESSGPTDEMYEVNLLNKDNQIADYNNTLTGTETFSFDTDGLAPGSYVVALYGTDGNYKAIQPVVISGYDVAVSVDETVETNSETTISVDVTAKQNAPELDAVKVMLSNDETTRTITASESSEGTYTATTSFDTSGEYRVFATARGTDTFNGEQEILGLSNVQSVSVTSDEQQSDSDSNSGSDDSTAETETADSTPTTQTTTADAQSSATPTQTVTATTQSTSTELSPADNETTQTPSTTSTTSPLQAAQLLLFVLVIVGAVYRLRED